MTRISPFLILLSFSFYLIAGCKHRSKSISFYYWRTHFQIDSPELAALSDNAVKTLYLRYFDLDIQPGDTMARVLSPVQFGKDTIKQTVVPVIFIKNRVFEHLDSQNLVILAQKTQKLVNSINAANQLYPSQIQFDCDWTDQTRLAYFYFLQQYRLITKQLIAATIRLHQVKYPIQTGIPPVDLGVLMYYNIGLIDASFGNSIYEPAIGARYIQSLKSYPLSMDIALPIFGWAQQIRSGKVIQLLNKMNQRHFENDSNFVLQKTGRFTAIHACFHGGYYFKEGDQIKTEHVSEKALINIVQSINANSNHRIKNLIFYDLDKENLALYEKDIFRKIMDATD